MENRRKPDPSVLEVPVKNRNFGDPGRRYLDQNGTTSITTISDMYHWQTSSTAVIQGDGRNPYPWSYTVNDFVRPFGKKSSFANGTVAVPYKVERGALGVGGENEKPFDPSWDQRTIVYNQALSNLNELTRGSLDLAVDLAELGSTRRMIRELGKVSRLASSVRDLWSGSALANGWLEFQYGWRPLMGTIFGLADESVRYVLNNVTTYRASSLAKEDRVDSVSQFVYSNNIPMTRRLKRKQACSVSVTMDVQGFDLARFSSLNPVSLAWELIPYSFVVDWFVDVGSYIRNLETGLLYNQAFRSGYASELHAADVLQTCSLAVVKPFTERYMYENITMKRRKREFVRTVFGSYPLPRIPSVKADLGSTQLLSAASLLRVLLGR
jgi:hypothetical protein